jgi:hypothetical protein
MGEPRKSVVDVLREFEVTPLASVRSRPLDEQRAVALENLDALTAAALGRTRKWQRKNGDPMNVADPDVKGALAAQTAAHEILGVGASPKQEDADGRPRALDELLAEARESIRRNAGPLKGPPGASAPKPPQAS